MGLSLIDESMDVSVAPVFNLDHMYQAFGDMRDELEMLMAVANVMKVVQMILTKTPEELFPDGNHRHVGLSL